MSDIRVLVVDDEAIIRRGLRLIVDGSDGMEVVGEAVDGVDGVRLTKELRPDVVLLDVRMPVMDGLAALGPIVDTGARAVVLTTFDVDRTVYDALVGGASGFLLKTSHHDDLVHAIRVAHRGDALIEPAVSRRLIERYAAEEATPATPAWAARLSEREREVLTLMALGHSNAEIARELHLGEATVKSHVTAVLAKLRVRDRLQAVVVAYRSGWVRN
jgi:DNA-binding NarL/FixJ family response regulator